MVIERQVSRSGIGGCDVLLRRVVDCLEDGRMVNTGTDQRNAGYPT